MLRNHRYLSLLPLVMLAAESGTASGGASSAKPKGTLEEQLTQARNDLATAQGSVSSLTTERDNLRSERDNIQNQFNSLTTTANETKTNLTNAQSRITQLEGELNTTKTTLTSAESNVTRLETLCDVKGIDRNASVPASKAPIKGDMHVFDKWSQAEGGEKTRLWRSHKAEIRAEGERRSKEGNRES